jgi:hypothetical protein
MATATEEIHVGDVGTVFEVTIKEAGAAVNISLATTKDFIFRKTSLVLITRGAAFKTNGTDGKLTYTTIAGDLDEAGVWALQAHVIETGKDHKTEVVKFKVHANL